MKTLISSLSCGFTASDISDDKRGSRPERRSGISPADVGFLASTDCRRSRRGSIFAGCVGLLVLIAGVCLCCGAVAEELPPPAVSATSQLGAVSGSRVEIPRDEGAVGRAEEPIPGAPPPLSELESAQGSFFEAGESDEAIPLHAVLGEGFEIRSADDQFQLRIRALTQLDGKLFLPADQEPARSGIYIPRFRAYFEGQLTDLYEYELSLQRSVEGAFDVLDANLNIAATEALQFRIGRALVPYSFAWYDHLEQFYITPERGLFPLNYGLARQAGIFAHGKVLDERLQYAIGGTFGQLSGLADTNTTRDGVVYLNLRPFLQTDDVPALRYLNIGGSLSIGRQEYATAPLPLRTSIQTSENDEAAQAASSIFLEFEEDVLARGERVQGALHASLYSGPVSIETECYAARFGMAAEPDRDDIGLPMFGYDVTVASFLTGETVRDRSTVSPRRPLTRAGTGWGAWELFGRYSLLHLSNEVFEAGLANPDDWTNRAAITDIGFNWYLNRYVRVTFDWQHAMYATPVLLNEAKDLRSRTNNLYWLRCQLCF